MKISICIPTYNRANHLSNCLQSIISNRLELDVDFQVCISDNCSTDETEKVVQDASVFLPVKYEKNKVNIGLARNIIKVAGMADGDFIWMIGDDDLLMSNAIVQIIELIDEHKKVDYFFINSNHLTTEYVLSFPQPFCVSNLPQDMERFSLKEDSGEMEFMDLINPKVSFDFLGGIFLSVFRRKNWVSKVNVIDQKAMADKRVFSHFDNTFPHVKVFSQAFANSRAYFYAQPLTVCLTGAREWSPMYSLIKCVRLVEALDEYRKNGLSMQSYLWCRNATMNTFFSDFAYLYLNRKTSGVEYINPFRLLISNCIYPNFYLSVLYYVLRKSKKLFIGKAL